MKVEVYDPPLCCSSGVCGTEVDPELVRFAALVEKIKARGVEVQRFNLAQQPLAFTQNETVRKELAADDKALPIVLLNNSVISRHAYPSEETLLSLLDQAPS